MYQIVTVPSKGVSLLYTMGKCPRLHLVKPDEVEITVSNSNDIGIMVSINLLNGVVESTFVDEVIEDQQRFEVILKNIDDPQFNQKWCNENIFTYPAL